MHIILVVQCGSQLLQVVIIFYHILCSTHPSEKEQYRNELILTNERNVKYAEARGLSLSKTKYSSS